MGVPVEVYRVPLTFSAGDQVIRLLPSVRGKSRISRSVRMIRAVIPYFTGFDMGGSFLSGAAAESQKAVANNLSRAFQ